MVKHIANGHGGRVSVASQVGHGATFTISLPVGGTAAEVPHGARAARPA